MPSDPSLQCGVVCARARFDRGGDPELVRLQENVGDFVPGAWLFLLVGDEAAVEVVQALLAPRLVVVLEEPARVEREI